MVIRCRDYVQPDEIQPDEFPVANTDAENNAGAGSVASAAAENNDDPDPAKTHLHACADSGETDAYAGASSRR